MEKRAETTSAGILFAYRFFFAGILSFSLFFCFREELGFQGNLFLQMLILAISLAVLLLVDCSRGRLSFFFASLLLGGLAMGGILRRAEEGEPQNAWEKLLGGLRLQELGILILLAIAVYLIWLLAERLWQIRLGITLLAVIGLAAAMALRQAVSHWGVTLLLIYLLATTAQLVQKRWEKRRQGGDMAYLLWLTPFFAVYFLILGILPYRDTPYDWRFVQILYQQAQKSFTQVTQRLFFGEDFGLSTEGFSEHSGFFGDRNRQDREDMLVKSPSLSGGIYLTGKLFDTFDGRKWTRQVASEKEDLRLNTAEMLYGVRRQKNASPSDYLTEERLSIEYRYLYTKCLFAPLGTFRIPELEEGKDYVQTAGQYEFLKKKGYGMTYQLRYDRMNLGHPEFAQLVQAAPSMQEDEAVWEQAARESGLSLSLEELAAYRERIRQQYAAAPKLSADVRQWLDEILEGAGTDWEKLRRIEEQLGSFTYDKRPGELPKEVRSEEQFLDYFLLENRVGYCSYFATAFVLLARAEGIPARYVQGFCIPADVSPGWSEKLYTVSSDMAHAWPEVYFEGFGWVPFEPTPGFGQYRNVSWKTSADKQKEQEQSQGQLAGSGASQGTFAQPTPEPEEETPLEENPPEKVKVSVWEWLRLAAYLFLGMAALAILFLASDALWERRRQRRKSAEENFRTEFLRNLQILEMLGFTRRSTETLTELREKLLASKELTQPWEALCGAQKEQDFLTACEEILYGRGRATKEMTARQHAAGELLLKELKRQKGWSYPFYRAWLYLTRAR